MMNDVTVINGGRAREGRKTKDLHAKGCFHNITLMPAHLRIIMFLSYVKCVLRSGVKKKGKSERTLKHETKTSITKTTHPTFVSQEGVPTFMCASSNKIEVILKLEF